MTRERFEDTRGGSPRLASEDEPRPLFGRNPVLELLRAGGRRVEEVAILAEGRGPALHELLGLAKRQVLQGVFFSHLGRVDTVDLIPQFADFGLQAEGVQWSVVSGVVDDEVHVSVRNVGYVRSAGDVTRAAFGELGMAGGHRTMAKAVFPLRRLGRGAGEPAASPTHQERIIERFLRALGGNGRASEGSPS